VSEADTCSESDYLSYVSHEIGVSWQSPRVTCKAARAEIIITSAECSRSRLWRHAFIRGTEAEWY